MKQKIFTLLLIAATGLTACQKNDSQPDIRQYDEQQIQTYISANGLSGYTADATADGAGTTGIYYKIINPGSGDSLKYSDRVNIVFTLKSFDGRYTSADTIANHFSDYLGYLAQRQLPEGLQLAIHNILKYKGGSMRLLIPSRLAYGVNGFGTGSITNVDTRIAGNQSLDYYVHVIGDQDVYDDKVINNYITANNLTGYIKDPLGYYYKINTAGTGTIGSINEFTNVTTTYTGSLINGFVFDSSASTTATVLTPNILIDGVKHALINHATTGTSISLLIPSSLGYGNVIQNSIPSSSVLKFDFNITGINI